LLGIEEILMSWDASFGGRSWNYTHNTSIMIYVVLKEVKEWPKGWGERDRSWWKILDGMTAKTAKIYLSLIIEGLEKEPERFRAMNQHHMMEHTYY
jgi:hypothetical protein